MRSTNEPVGLECEECGEAAEVEVVAWPIGRRTAAVRLLAADEATPTPLCGICADATIGHVNLIYGSRKRR